MAKVCLRDKVYGKKKDKHKRREGAHSGHVEAQETIEALTGSGHQALIQGDCADAVICFKKAFNASLELQDIRAQRACAFNLGAAYVESGKPGKGLSFLKRAQPGDRGGRVADLQFNLGAAHKALGDVARAAKHYLQAAQLYRSQGESSSEGDTCMKLAYCHQQLQDWAQAATAYQRAGECYRLAGQTDTAATALKEAADLMHRCDGTFSMEDVISVLTECLQLCSGIKHEKTLSKLYNDLGLSFTQLKFYQEAVECFERALPLAHTQPDRQAVVLQNLGAVYNTLGRHQQGLSYHQQAAALHGSLGSRGAQGQCFSNLAFAFAELGKHQEAGDNYLHALQAFKDTDDAEGQWQASEGLGEAMLSLGDAERATMYYKQALGLLAKCRQPPNSAQERLVNKLTDALQYRLSHGRDLTPAGPQRSLNESNSLRRRLPRDQQAQLRSSGIRASQLQHPGLANYARDAAGGASMRCCYQGEVGDPISVTAMTESHPQQTFTSVGQFSSHTVQPEANRNVNNTSVRLRQPTLGAAACSTQHSECQCGIVKQDADLNSEPSLTQSSGVCVSEESTPLFRRLKSRVCTLM